MESILEYAEKSWQRKLIKSGVIMTQPSRKYIEKGISYTVRESKIGYRIVSSSSGWVVRIDVLPQELIES